MDIKLAHKISNCDAFEHKIIYHDVQVQVSNKAYIANKPMIIYMYRVSETQCLSSFIGRGKTIDVTEKRFSNEIEQGPF